MAVNISSVLSGDWTYVRDDIAAVVDVTHAAGQKVKVIFENCYLNSGQKIRLCEICSELMAYGASGGSLPLPHGRGSVTELSYHCRRRSSLRLG
jgi:hypothetical protein